APPSDGNGAGIEENSASGSEILLKFTQLYSENQDFAGWLRIPGTKIDYPVMSREGDNNYYLDKNFEQQHDKNGLLILDYR
ncbi:class B sortase, partial [Klebsiella oxytoca]